MNTSELITEIDAEIDRLMQARNLLLTGASFLTDGRKPVISAEGKARIAAAQKKRWRSRRRRERGSGSVR